MTDFNRYPFAALFVNNGHASGFGNLAAFSQNPQTIGPHEIRTCGKTVIPVVSYDYKNQTEALHSGNPSGYTTSDLLLVVPDTVYEPSARELQCWLDPRQNSPLPALEIRPRISRSVYLEQVRSLQKHIALGDIYEVNFCMEFYATGAELPDPFALFARYNALARAPMSCYIKYGHLHLLCGSPERFLKKTGSRLVSQPIKGTRRRSANPAEDALLKEELKNDPKERAENVMIVDLVRNDLSRIAQRGSVQVDELCGIYGFEHVYQSISTVSCTVEKNTDFGQILQALFPMGSMTGAPKIKAMELIETHESTKRQWYSGTTGYISPSGDFDLNVIIRSMVYDAQNHYLSFEVGSAITAASDPEKEYEECLVKARGMMQALEAQAV